ncbi:TetR/AcrR family transcriptional regulator [Phreatobacter sp. AB_2022a]|uniref:TetR/AcrR family transcriptional regulator n=1 Tax=Phreatobacter sp. AB_2022a TaxID=3003134 RepID=UPI00228739F8|nr:WHG domain-containing protein [Phreatobacter sp. AB_2022a]MCZ0737559.1 WHG domain-containing protein [Phreatobacter sp. AB_2022a]
MNDSDKPEKQAPRGGRYHHGALREALLASAERILERDGVQGLTLRAAAREAGVSHAAPMNHFGDLTGLLSELAALGFERFRAAMQAGLDASRGPQARMSAIGRAYVRFARTHPGLFQLMFRSERLDPQRPALAAAMRGAYLVLAGTVGERREEAIGPRLTEAQAAQIMAAWSLVHGFAVLSLDGRFDQIVAHAPEGATQESLFEAILRGPDEKAAI